MNEEDDFHPNVEFDGPADCANSDVPIGAIVSDLVL